MKHTQEQYDYLGRRVRSTVAGLTTFAVYDTQGELLAELDTHENVLRSYVYLDGEPYAQVVTRAGTATRPPQTGGCSSTTSSSAIAVALVLVALVAIGRRKYPQAAFAILFVVALRCGPSGQKDHDRTLPGDDTPNANGRQSPPAGRPALTDPVYYYHTDRQATPQRMTDQNGRLVWRGELRPFGDLQSIETDPSNTGTPVENNLRFPGQYDDSLSSLLMVNGPYYNGHRYYAPDLGRYMAADPMTAVPQYILATARSGTMIPAYAYAANNPLIYIDPLGLLTAKACGYVYVGILGKLDAVSSRLKDVNNQVQFCVECSDDADEKFKIAGQPPPAGPATSFTSNPLVQGPVNPSPGIPLEERQQCPCVAKNLRSYNIATSYAVLHESQTRSLMSTSTLDYDCPNGNCK